MSNSNHACSLLAAIYTSTVSLHVFIMTWTVLHAICYEYDAYQFLVFPSIFLPRDALQSADVLW